MPSTPTLPPAIFPGSVRQDELACVPSSSIAASLFPRLHSLPLPVTAPIATGRGRGSSLFCLEEYLSFLSPPSARLINTGIQVRQIRLALIRATPLRREHLIKSGEICRGPPGQSVGRHFCASHGRQAGSWHRLAAERCIGGWMQVRAENCCVSK